MQNIDDVLNLKAGSSDDLKILIDADKITLKNDDNEKT